MSRLTKWKCFKTNKKLFRANSKISVSDLTWKVGQVEDIEDELKLSLAKLFKCRKKCYVKYEGWYGDVITYGRLVKIDFDRGIVIIRANEEDQKDHAMGGYQDALEYYEAIENYGKTWALTKAELEKGAKQ